MTNTGLTNVMRRPTFGAMTRCMILTLAAGALLEAGCVNVTAPDKPIEINLNVNVTQEVVYRLDSEAKSLIKDNPGIF